MRTTIIGVSPMNSSPNEGNFLTEDQVLGVLLEAMQEAARTLPRDSKWLEYTRQSSRALRHRLGMPALAALERAS